MITWSISLFPNSLTSLETARCEEKTLWMPKEPHSHLILCRLEGHILCCNRAGGWRTPTGGVNHFVETHLRGRPVFQQSLAIKDYSGKKVEQNFEAAVCLYRLLAHKLAVEILQCDSFVSKTAAESEGQKLVNSKIIYFIIHKMYKFLM